MIATHVSREQVQNETDTTLTQDETDTDDIAEDDRNECDTDALHDTPRKTLIGNQGHSYARVTLPRVRWLERERKP